MNRTEFAQGLALLTGAVGKPMPDEQIASWFALLNELTPEQFRRGIVETLRTHQFAGFPPVGSVRTNALAGVASTVAPKDRPVAAWLAVRTAIVRVGGYASPNFADPVINAVIRDLGGWPVVCDTPTSELPWLEKRFREAYVAYSGVALRPYQTARLVGITEIDNNAKGYRSEPIHVADVACLTVESEQVESVRMRLEVVEPASTQAQRQADETVGQLARQLSVDTPEASQGTPAVNATTMPQLVDDRDVQIAALKRMTGRRGDQSKTG